MSAVITAQALYSLADLVAVVGAGWVLSAEEFGKFAVAFTVFTFLNAVIRTSVADVELRLSRLRRSSIGAGLISRKGWKAAVVCLAALAVAVLASDFWGIGALLLPILIPFGLTGPSIRTLSIYRGEYASVIRVDALSLITVVLGLVVMPLAGVILTAGDALAFWLLSLAIPWLIGSSIATDTRRRWSLAECRMALSFAVDVSLGLATRTAATVVAAATLSLPAAGAIRLAESLIAPMNVLSEAARNLAMPRIASSQARLARRRAWQTGVALTTATVAYVGLVFVGLSATASVDRPVAELAVSIVPLLGLAQVFRSLAIAPHLLLRSFATAGLLVWARLGAAIVGLASIAAAAPVRDLNLLVGAVVLSSGTTLVLSVLASRRIDPRVVQRGIRFEDPSGS